MADIRNDGQSKVDIESAEILSGDINLKVRPKPNYTPILFQGSHNSFPNSFIGIGNSLFKKSVGQGEEISDLYVFSITEPISIDAKTNYLLPMFHPQVTVEQYASISTHFNGAGNVSGKAERTFCLSSDRSLSRGDCIIRESDRLVGQTYLPDIAAKHKHEFSVASTSDLRVLANVKIYSNLAEIIQPLGKLPIEFSSEDWNNIRSDSVTLVGNNVTITQQTLTEKKKSLNNAQVYVRAPSSSNTETKFVKATMIDEKHNLVKIIDKDISKEPIFFTAQPDHIVYENEPPQTKYYVNFTYDTSDAVYLSYLRSNLNWKTRYQLNLFENVKPATLIAMADIRNDGQSKVDIESAELLGGDINLQMYGVSQYMPTSYAKVSDSYSEAAGGMAGPPPPPSVGQGEEVSGLYVFAISEPISIDAKTNYLLPMFRPRVTVERYASISKYFYGAGNVNGKAERAYRLSSDRFLSSGNCIIRESDRLVGETSLPDIAAKNKHEFSVGKDADIVYKENATLVSSYTTNVTTSHYGVKQTRTQSTYDLALTLKNYKNRPVKIEYQQRFHGQSLKLIKSTTNFTQDGSTIKATFTLASDEEKTTSYKFEVVN
ncbi:unnamed protein product [Rotaria sp. Silwood1]|nr:unnamed protein product [Rotaria sp. Silwood1]